MLNLYVSDFFHFKNVQMNQIFVVCRAGWDFAMPVVPYGAQWRKQRKTFQQHFHANEVYKDMPIQRQEVHTLLRRLLVTPEDFFHHTHQ